MKNFRNLEPADPKEHDVEGAEVVLKHDILELFNHKMPKLTKNSQENLYF